MQKVDKRTKSKTVVGFGERMDVAAAAKKALLEKLKSKQVDVNDPAYIAQQEAKKVAAAVRDEREAQRRAEKEAAKAQALADRKAAHEAAEAQVLADEAARLAAEAEAAEALIVKEQQAKAARDARYAARKARK